MRPTKVTKRSYPIRSRSGTLVGTQVRQENTTDVQFMLFVLAVYCRCAADGCHLSNLSGEDQGRLPGRWTVSPPGFVLTLLIMDRRGFAFCRRENAYKMVLLALLATGGGCWTAADYFIAPRARKFASSLCLTCLRPGITRQRACWAPSRSCSLIVGITSYQFKGGGNVLHLIFPDTALQNWAPTYCCVRHCHYALAGMSSWLTWTCHGSLVTVICIIATLISSQGWRLGWAACALPPSHFQVLGNLTLARGLSSWCRTLLAYAR